MRNILVLAVLAVVALVGFSGYNGMVGADEKVNAAWAQVQTQTQRRLDLVPALVETVKSYAGHEAATLEAVTSARAKATAVTASPADIEKFKAAQSELSAALGKLMMVREAYPTLKADATFLRLQDELAGTENRIAVARRDYNEQVREFNTKVRGFPGMLVAGTMGLSPRPFFEADEAAAKAPTVKF